MPDETPLSHAAARILDKLAAGKHTSPAELALLREASAVDPNDRATREDLGLFLISGGSVRGRRLTPLTFCLEAEIDPGEFEALSKDVRADMVSKIIGKHVDADAPAMVLAWPLAKDYYSVELALAELNSRLQNPAALDSKGATDAAAQIERLAGKRGPIIAHLMRMF
jgi:hypothetical protein